MAPTARAGRLYGKCPDPEGPALDESLEGDWNRRISNREYRMSKCGIAALCLYIFNDRIPSFDILRFLVRYSIFHFHARLGPEDLRTIAMKGFNVSAGWGKVSFLQNRVCVVKACPNPSLCPMAKRRSRSAADPMRISIGWPIRSKR